MVCKSPVGSRLYKQAKKPSDLRRIVRARRFGSKITSQKEILDFSSVLLIDTQCIGNKHTAVQVSYYNMIFRFVNFYRR